MEKEKFDKIRKIAKTGKCSREQYLAYAFLRGRKYITLERKINEDKFPEIGRNSFLMSLASIVAFVIEGNWNNCELRKDIQSWLMEKYASEKLEAAE